MKKPILLMMLAACIIMSCSSGKKFQASSSEDKPLFDAINALKKRPDNSKAQYDLKLLYKQSVERHEEAIAVYKNSQDENRWDKILQEQEALQHIYNSLQATPGSIGIVKPKSYLKDIEETKLAAAEFYYARGNESLALEGRDNSLQAYDHFQRANAYVAGYKETNKLMKEAFEKSIINVVINPIDDNNAVYSVLGTIGNIGSGGYGYRPQEYQESLVRDLGGRSASNIPARFFTDRDVRRERIPIDREVDIRWRSIQPPRITPNQYTRQASKKIENGKDSTGKPIYQTVYATLNVNQRNYAVQADMEYKVTDLNDSRNTQQGLIHDDVTWSESTATYSGDSRALSQEDWNLVNNRNNIGQQVDLMNNIMKKLYPQLRRKIQESVY